MSACPSARKPGSSIEVLANLPCRLPGYPRLVGRDRFTGRRLEIRVLSGQGTARSRGAQLERDLLRLDHPCFPPVLDRGDLRGQRFYAVPLREHPSLESLLEDPGFTWDQRLRVLRHLRAAVAHAHARGVTLGKLDPRHIAVDRASGVPTLLHHDGTSGPAPEGDRRARVREDLRGLQRLVRQVSDSGR